MFEVLILNFLYALVFPIGKIAVEKYTTPLFLTATRMLLGSLIIFAIQFKFKKNSITLPRNLVWPLLCGAFFCYYLTNALEFWALDYLSATRVCIIYNLYPFVTILFSYIYTKEKLSYKRWGALMIGLIGSMPILLLKSSVPAGITKTYIGLPYLPELAVLASTVFYAYGWLSIQKVLVEDKYDYNMASCITMIFAGIMAISHSFLIDKWHPLPIYSLSGFILTVGGITLIFNVIYNALYFRALKTYSLTFLSFTGFIDPLFTSVFDFLFFGIVISWHFYLSFVFTFIGFYLLYKTEMESQVKVKSDSGIQI